MKKLYIICLLIFVSVFFTACGKNKNMSPQAIVDTKDVKQEQIIEKIDSTGRVIAKYDVQIVARIDGYLQKKYFQEGSIVKKGDLLFQIEPYTYAAKVNEASANLRNAQAAAKDSAKNLQRAAQLVKDDYISKADYDNKLATRDKDKASVDSAKATLTQAKINYGYTKITSPINGKIGKIFITEGNYVTPSSGTLAKIVSLDPVYIDFPLKSKSYITLKKASKVDDLSDISVEITLADGNLYSSKGKIEFIDNKIDENTGTVTMRAMFPNKDNLLVPGDYVAVKIILEIPETVILVPQEAVLESEEGKYLYIIDENKIAKKRFIEVGDEYNGNWIVKTGLQPGDKVAITGVQYIQDNGPVILAKELKAQKVAQAKIKASQNASFSGKLKRKFKFILGK